MASNSSEIGVGRPDAVQPGLHADPAAALDQMQGLLKAKDDTSRFVGLALLKSIIDNQPQLRENEAQLRILWESISPKFLDRLLRSGQNKKVSKVESRDMIDIAVAVLHTFTVLLPPEARDDKRLVGRLPALVGALLESSPESTVLMLQTLLTIVSQLSGAQEFLKLDDVSNLTEIAPQQPLVLDIFSLAWSNASTEAGSLPAVRSSLTSALPLLLIVFQRTDAVTFLAFIGTTFPRLPPQVLPEEVTSPWIDAVLLLIRTLVTSRPTKEGRSAYTQAAAALLQAYPVLCPPLIFNDHGGIGEKSPPADDAKPFSYLFINLLLIDIRSSFPSLLSKLNSIEYPTISKRLGAAFDIISSFIGFLVRSLDDEDDEYSKVTSGTNLMPPDLLLKLRKDIAETLSLAIEYLRDRYDSSVAGASGLHPSARSGTSATSEGTRLTLTWESKEHSVTSDTLILASIRTLSIWLREDDNENLRNESAGLMDLLVHLYRLSSQESVHTVSDYRYPVLTALEAILTTEDGVDGFLAQDGWSVLVQDLNLVITNTTSKHNAQNISLIETEASRGIEIVRVMLAIIDHESTSEPREDWMEVVKAAATMQPTIAMQHPIIIELKVAVLQLAVALLNIATVGMQKRYATSITGISGAATQLQRAVTQLGGEIGRDFNEELDDVLLAIENLR